MWQVPAGGGRKTSSCSSQPKSKELEFRALGKGVGLYRGIWGYYPDNGQ